MAIPMTSLLRILVNGYPEWSWTVTSITNKNGIEFMSADDILYGSSDDKLTTYQKDWLRNYIEVWDIIVNY